MDEIRSGLVALCLIAFTVACGSKPRDRESQDVDIGVDVGAPTGPLLAAASAGSLPEVARLLGEGAEANVTDKDGNTPLHFAAKSGNPKLAKLLMRHGADPKARNKSNFSPLFIASVVEKDMDMTAVLMVAKEGGAVEPAPPVDFGSQPRTFGPLTTTASLVQVNPTFGYRLVVSPDWKIAGRQQDGMIRMQSIFVMTLPPVWSDLENQNIENAISVYAKGGGAAKTQEEAVAYFKKTKGANAQDLKAVQADGASAFEYSGMDGGLKYALRTHVLCRNGIVYFIDFIATPGTFDRNSPVFLAFARSLEFFEPR